MRYLPVLALTAATMLAASLVPASAAPLTGLAAPKGDTGGLIKVHGWHGYCAWGPLRYHRHVEGIGNVPCYRHYYRDRDRWNRDYDDNDYRRHRYRRWHHRHHHDDDD